MAECEHLSNGDCMFAPKNSEGNASKAVSREREWLNWWSGRGGVHVWNECMAKDSESEQRHCSAFRPRPRPAATP